MKSITKPIKILEKPGMVAMGLLLGFTLSYAQPKTAIEQKDTLVESIISKPPAASIVPNWDSARACNARGLAASKKGDLGIAFRELNKAIEYGPQYARAYYNRGLLNYNAGDNVAAINDFTDAIYLDSTFAPAYNVLASALDKDGQPEAAAENRKIYNDLLLKRTASPFPESGSLPKQPQPGASTKEDPPSLK